MKKIILAIIIKFAFYGKTHAAANEIGIYVTGLSYHIGAGKNNKAYSNGKFALDKYGAFVLNPGIGFTIDCIRYNFSKKSTISLLPLLMTFGDCDFRATYVLGAGPRFKFFFLENFSFHIDCFLSLYRAQIWETNQYTNTFVPFTSVNFSYHWQKWNLGLSVTYSPKSGNSSSIGHFHILFIYLYLGIKF